MPFRITILSLTHIKIQKKDFKIQKYISKQIKGSPKYYVTYRFHKSQDWPILFNLLFYLQDQQKKKMSMPMQKFCHCLK